MRTFTAAAAVFAAAFFAAAQAEPTPAATSAEVEARIAELEATVDLLEDVALDQQAEIMRLRAEKRPEAPLMAATCQGEGGIC